MTHLLRLHEVDAHYGRIRALSAVSLHVDEGEIVTLIGANGAGKTTTLRAISGLIRPSGGTIEFAEQNLLRLTPDHIVRAGIGHSPEGRRVFARMTVRENLDLGAFSRHAKSDIARDMEYVLETFPRLRERLDQRAGTLSGGEQQMLAIGRALMSSPTFLMLDEPSMGLAPRVVEQLFEVLRGLQRHGLTLLVAEQNAAMALGHADRGTVIESGRIALDGTAARLREDDAVREAYLGV